MFLSNHRIQLCVYVLNHGSDILEGSVRTPKLLMLCGVRIFNQPCRRCLLSAELRTLVFIVGVNKYAVYGIEPTFYGVLDLPRHVTSTLV